MSAERRKGERPEDEAAEADRAARRGVERAGARREAGGRPTIDEREEEGYGQPESSAQKPRRPEDEMLGE